MSSTPVPSPARARKTPPDRRWPLKVQLVPETKPFLAGAHLLVAADCTLGACPAFLGRHQPGKVLLLACPKLEDKKIIVEKLARIIQVNQPPSLTVARMKLPCCCLTDLVHQAVATAGGDPVPVRVVPINIDGHEEFPAFGPARPA